MVSVLSIIVIDRQPTGRICSMRIFEFAGVLRTRDRLRLPDRAGIDNAAGRDGATAVIIIQ